MMGAEHKAHKIVCCVRNPFDVIVSKMHFNCQTQGGQVEQNFAKDLPEVWDKFIREMAQSIQLYHDILIKEQMQEVPIHFMRYEDLLNDPQKTIENLFSFLLGVESVNGMNIQKRITECVNKGH